MDLGAPTSSNPGGYLFGASVYRGNEAPLSKAYWNIGFGLNSLVFMPADTGDCVLTARATASATRLDASAEDFALPEGEVYPVIDWSVPRTNATIGRVCTAHEVNDGAGVQTHYYGYLPAANQFTWSDGPVYMRHQYDTDSGEVETAQASCTPLGQTYASGLGQRCEGLAAISPATPNEDGACPLAPPFGALLCSASSGGDASCESFENHCNCPEDCEAPCVSEGSSWNDIFGPNGHECCEGLSTLSVDASVDGGSCVASMCFAAWKICTDCGDGQCGAGESFCTCPEDCSGSCVEQGGVTLGDTGCCAPLTPVPLEDGADPACLLHACVACGDGACDLGETEESCPFDCATCTPAGEHCPTAMGYRCEGLEGLSPSGPDGMGGCFSVVGGTLCSASACGDDVCEAFENYCNCPDDCDTP